jgi:hypothetical protein
MRGHRPLKHFPHLFVLAFGLKFLAEFTAQLNAASHADSSVEYFAQK